MNDNKFKPMANAMTLDIDMPDARALAAFLMPVSGSLRTNVCTNGYRAAARAIFILMSGPFGPRVGFATDELRTNADSNKVWS